MDFRRSLMSVIGVAAIVVLSGAMAPAAAQNFKWRYYSVPSAGHSYSVRLIEGFKKIEERSNGRLKIELVPYGTTPYKASDALKLLRDGLGDMGEWLIGYNTNTYPLLNVPELPYIFPKKMTPGELTAGMDKAWTSPVIKGYVDKIMAEHKVKSLGLFYWPPQNFWFRKPVSGPSEFSGLRIREYTIEGVEFIKLLGGIPVSMTSAEAYLALQRGMLDGAVTASTTMTGSRWYEVLSAGYITNYKAAASMHVVSERALRRLPDDLKQILVEEMGNATEVVRKFMISNEPELLSVLEREHKFTITHSTEADYGAMRKLSFEKVIPGWLEKAGPDARAALNDVMQAIGAPERF